MPVQTPAESSQASACSHVGLHVCDRCREVRGDVVRVHASTIVRTRESYLCAKCLRRSRRLEPLMVFELVDDDD